MCSAIAILFLLDRWAMMWVRLPQAHVSASIQIGGGSKYFSAKCFAKSSFERLKC